MKKWKETKEVVFHLGEELAAGRTAVLATITHIEGSTYRRPGAKLLIREDRSSVGNISGGCLEHDVVEHAMAIMKDRESRSVSYDTDGEDDVWGLGLGCKGQVRIFLRPFDAKDMDLIEQALAMLRARESFTIYTQLEGEKRGLMEIGPAQPRSGEIAMWADSLVPPPKVLLCGGGDDSSALSCLATDLGFHVTISDHRPANVDQSDYPKGTELRIEVPEQLTESLDSETYVVIKMHSFRWDRAWFEKVYESSVPYIGILGSRERRDEICARIPAACCADRVYGPAGLDIGAEGAEQIALSIMAEIMAIWGHREVGHLRDAARAIHQV